MTLSLAAIEQAFAVYFWPFVRIAALLMVAPVFSASMVAPRVRILVALGLTWSPFSRWSLAWPWGLPCRSCLTR